MTPEERCRAYRRRILDISQKVPALHIGGAFSCIEIVDCIYNDLMKPDDVFIMSKGHAGIAQYVVLESQGKLSLDDYAEGTLGIHPDRKTPGIDVSTGSLGHGLGIAVGMALAEPELRIYVLISDGELQEGSTWEAVGLASALNCKNIVVFVDNNGLQSAYNRTYPIGFHSQNVQDMFMAHGWDAFISCGHESKMLRSAAMGGGEKPSAVVAHTVKGHGVSFMQNDPKWHYRSPSPEEYEQACKELAA